jgi:hypothetical protein
MRIVQHEDTLDQVVSVLAHQAKGRRFETSWGLRTHAVHHISRIWLAECVRFLSPDGCAHTTPMAKLQRLKRFKCSRSPCVLRHSTSIIFLFSRPLQFSILDVNIPKKNTPCPCVHESRLRGYQLDYDTIVSGSIMVSQERILWDIIFDNSIPNAW